MTRPISLLPSQQAQLNLLTFAIEFSQQLILLVGKSGSGKSSILSELTKYVADDYQIIKIACPKHVQCAELRQKLLIQISPSSVFDDEQSLSVNLQNWQSKLTRSLHIVIDDAHRLPLSIWYEYLELLSCNINGQPIGITFSCDPKFVTRLKAQLTSTQWQLISVVDIAPLSLADCEQLTDWHNSQTSVDNVKSMEQLAKCVDEITTPEQLLAFLSVKTPSVSEPLVKDQKPKKQSKRTMRTILLSSVLIFLVIIYMRQWNQEPITLPAEQLQQVHQAVEAKSLQEEDKLVIDIEDTKKNTNHTPALFPDLPNKASLPVSQLSAEIKSKTELLKVLSLAEIDDIELAAQDANDELFENKQDVKQSKEIVELTSAKLIDTNQAGSSIRPLPQQGYTIQLARLRQRTSLDAMLINLADQPLWILKDEQAWLVVVGEYFDKQQAMNMAKKLASNYQISSPWVRKWTGMTKYPRYHP